MRTLLSQTLVLAVLVAALPQFAHADFINVISQSYHIRGYGLVSTPRGPVDVVDYDLTSNSPLSRNDYVDYVAPPGEIPGLFWITTNATGGAFASSAFVQADVSKNDISSGAAIYSDASASVTFVPLEREIILRREREILWFRGSSSLYDETAGVMILEFGPSYPFSPLLPPPSEDYRLLLDLGHTYTMTASVGPNNLTPGENGARLRLVSAAESESVLTFFALGLTVFGLILRNLIGSPGAHATL